MKKFSFSRRAKFAAASLFFLAFLPGCFQVKSPTCNWENADKYIEDGKRELLDTIRRKGQSLSYGNVNYISDEALAKISTADIRLAYSSAEGSPSLLGFIHVYEILGFPNLQFLVVWDRKCRTEVKWIEKTTFGGQPE